ncbi:MAG: FAD-dependent oxidoreductase [Alphaproteobacteria bacterium]|nr:FAD-dependent oxidoreductase [Alphaproteobacteria bacterium]
MTQELPSAARAVVIGGGIAGCSVAYHLTKNGWRDVVLLEQGRLTGGTTWHAAGLVGQLRASRSMTRMSRYGTELYARLEAETGQATGWKRCGSLTIARTPERMTVLKRSIAAARSFGLEAEFLAPAEAGRRWPLMRSDDLVGAVWFPGDGKANPVDLTQSLAKGARLGGARIIEGVRVTGFDIERGRLRKVRTDQGDIACEVVVNAAGQWARQLGALAGVSVPLYPAEHFYLVTKPIAGVTPDLPVLRDPDGYIYFKEEVGGLVMGGFEPEAKPWDIGRVPDDFAFQLLPEDWDQFAILMENALHRAPCLETAEVRQLLNGPESFTPDGAFLLGEAPEVEGFHVCAGFNSAGIANSGAAGRALADWIVAGEPQADLWEVDIRRFAPFHANRRHLRERTVESLGLHYAMRWPRMELKTARPLRRSPLYDRLVAKGAVFGGKMGWERALYFLTPGTPEPPYGFAKPGWLPAMRAEQRAVREAVGVFDLGSFGKLLLQGPDAMTVLERLCANRMDVPVGRAVYTAMLNTRGGFESDFTALRLAEDAYLIVTGTAQAVRDAAWIKRRLGGARAVLTDVTGAWSVLSVMGPKARTLLERLGPDDLAHAWGESREIDLALARVRALRMAYVGGPGYELYVPTEFAAGVYDALLEAGADLGLRDCGYHALDALRIEAGRKAFGAELGPDDTPLEAGLAFAVAFDKGDFIGRDALLRQREHGITKRLALFRVEDPDAFPWGGEPILHDGVSCGEATSAGYSDREGRALVMGYVRAEDPATLKTIASSHFELDLAGRKIALTYLAKAPFAG